MIKLNKIEKIISIIVVLLFISAIIISIVSFSKTKNIPNSAYLNTYTIEKLPTNLKTQSKKIKLFEELYNSSDRIVAYSIETNTLNRKENQEFDEKFKERFYKSNLNYKLITYSDIEKIKKEYLTQNINISSNESSCGYSNETEKEFDEFINNTENCLVNVCVIDSKNNTFTIISRDVEYVLGVLKKLN
jgi:hypothetical protein